MKTDVWVASLAWDYRAKDDVPTRPVRNDDTKLPIASVWFRVAYGLGYLGDDAVRRLRDIYEAQGIGFYGVVVPSGTTNWRLQREQALSALKLCRGLEFDVEPYGGYLGSEAGLQAWVENVLYPLRMGHPNELEGKDVSLCYDPREQWLDGWDFAKAVGLSDSLAPMVYTGMFGGQGAWGEPALAIRRARMQCPLSLAFRPILQTYSIDPMETMAAFHEAVRVDGRPILFRRGVTPVETWNAIAAAKEPSPPVPVEEDTLSSKEYEELSRQIRSLKTWVQSQVHNPIVSRIESIEADIKALSKQPAPAPAAPEYYVVKRGDTAGAIAKAHGLTLWPNQDGTWGGTFADLNGHSRDWNMIYGGEKLRVR